MTVGDVRLRRLQALRRRLFTFGSAASSGTQRHFALKDTEVVSTPLLPRASARRRQAPILLASVWRSPSTPCVLSPRLTPRGPQRQTRTAAASFRRLAGSPSCGSTQSPTHAAGRALVTRSRLALTDSRKRHQCPLRGQVGAQRTWTQRYRPVGHRSPFVLAPAPVAVTLDRVACSVLSAGWKMHLSCSGRWTT